MRWVQWWQMLLVLHAHTLAQGITPTICNDEACLCDSFTRVTCSCTRGYEEVTLRADGAYSIPSTTTAIFINGCARVHFLQDSVKSLIRLRAIEIRNVSHVVINERAMDFARTSDSSAGIRIVIDGSTINEIASHAVQGRVDEIVIKNCRINNLKPFAFSSLTGVKTVELTNNVFDNIEIQAFKKFTTVNFLLRGGIMKTLPSRFLSDVEVTNLFRMEGVTIKYLSSLTFLVSSPKRVLIENNNIETLDGDGFHIAARGPITFRNNTVTNLSKGSFFGISVEMEIISSMGRQELLIDNNTITNLTPSSLMFNRTSLTLRVDGLNLNISCTCELAEEWREILTNHGGLITCWYTLEEHFISLPTFVDSRCGSFKQNYWIFVIVGIIIVMIGAAIAIYFIVRRENEKKKKLQIVLPDGKTYRETEFHIVVERAELLTTNL